MFALQAVPLSRCSHSPHGYSLFELVILLLIIGLIGGLSLSAGKIVLDVSEANDTKERLDTIRAALLLFQKTHERYPCPALPADSSVSATYGVEVAGGCAGTCPAGLTCGKSAVIGAVPFKTLRVNEEVAYDSGDNKIAYVIDKAHTHSSVYSTGSIPIIDINGNGITSSSVMGAAIFILISHGKDGKGAYDKSGTMLTACGATGADIENCNGDDIFVHSRLNRGDIAANYYDDFIVWQTQENVQPEVFNK